MTPFLVVSHAAGCAGAAPADDLASALAAAHWSLTLERGRTRLFGPAEPSLSLLVRGDGRALVVGDIYPAAGAAPVAVTLDATAAAAPDQACARLMQAAWGRYILIFLGVDGALEGVARDPSGALGCTIWRSRGRVIVSTAPGRVLQALAPDHWGIDWEALADQLADPAALALGSSLVGVHSVPPGSLYTVATGAEHAVWTPARIARRTVDDPTEARARVRDAVDDAVRRLAAARPIASEVSGGLDSAIVSASLAGVGADVRLRLNMAGPDAEADERRYAQSLCRALGAPLRVIGLPELSFNLAALEDLAVGITPSISGFDPPADRAMLEAVAEAGASTLFTGLGGDAVFWVAPSPLVMADRLARLGWRALMGPTLPDTARWCRLSVPATLWAAVRALQRPPGFPTTPPAWLTRPARPHAHPWLADLEGLAPGKRVQIESLVHMHSTLGVTRRSLRFDVIHPLLSQPVVEACLQIPLDRLANGRDRSLARAAFADRLPQDVLERRSKGDLTRRYGAALAAALDEIRPFLLDGRLAAAGLIDRDRLDQVLDEDAFARSGETLSIYRALATEAWVRHWAPLCAGAPAGA